MKDFYSINTYECEINKSKLINTIYFERKQDAIDRMTALFKKCYPHGFKCGAPDVIKACIESPKYNDHDCYLQRFYTTASYCYELSTEVFQ